MRNRRSKDYLAYLPRTSDGRTSVTKPPIGDDVGWQTIPGRAGHMSLLKARYAKDMHAISGRPGMALFDLCIRSSVEVGITAITIDRWRIHTAGAIGRCAMLSRQQRPWFSWKMRAQWNNDRSPKLWPGTDEEEENEWMRREEKRRGLRDRGMSHSSFIFCRFLR